MSAAAANRAMIYPENGGFGVLLGGLTAAKAFVDAPLLGIIGMLEGNCTARREPEFFL